MDSLSIITGIDKWTKENDLEFNQQLQNKALNISKHIFYGINNLQEPSTYI